MAKEPLTQRATPTHRISILAALEVRIVMESNEGGMGKKRSGRFRQRPVNTGGERDKHEGFDIDKTEVAVSSVVDLVAKGTETTQYFTGGWSHDGSDAVDGTKRDGRHVGEV